MAGETDAPTPTQTLTRQDDAPVAALVRHGQPPVVDAPLPDWARASRQAFDQFHNWRRLRTHQGWSLTKQVPRFLALLLVYSPRGLWRLVALLGRYLYDHDSATVRHHHALNVETPEYERASKRRAANLKARWIVSASLAVAVAAPALMWLAPHVLAGLLGVLVAVWIVKLIPGKNPSEYLPAVLAGGAIWWFLPQLLVAIPTPPVWPFLVGGVLFWLALGWIGRPDDRKLVQSATPLAAEHVRLTAPMVTGALVSLGNSRMKEPEQIALLMDVARVGPGYQIDLELPPGVPATWVIARRSELAASLRRELGCVWPGVGSRHEAHLRLYVADQPMVKARQAPWPLAKTGMVDVFDAQPMFTDQQGSWVSLTLAYANMVIGAVPRVGKTFILRQTLLVAGLDPRTKVYALDGKGTGDLAPCALFAHFYSVGDEPDEVERVLLALRGLREEMRRRARVVRELPHDECPESKVTSALAGRPGLEPVVVGIDETQAYFCYGDKNNKAHKAIREELAAIVTDLVKRGPALGVIVALATQNVTDATIPTQISTNAVIRVCLKVIGHQPNDQILGTGAYHSGINATQFSSDDKGIAYLRADGANPQIVRSVFGLDTVKAEEIGKRARAVRKARNRLTGYAAGEDMAREEEQVELLTDARHVMDAAGVSRVHLGDLRARLTLLRSETYKHLTNDSLSAQLRSAGVQVGSVWAKQRSDKGIKREWLDVAATDEIGDADA